MSSRLSRRQFLQAAIAAGTAVPFVGPRPVHAAPASPRSAGEKLNLAAIGVANKGASNIAPMAGENIVLLCDIDANYLQAAKAKYPHAKTCEDFREVFEHPDLDGVIVSTPDHTHALPVAMALRKGLPVYCEKPLTHSLYEARLLGRLAAESGAATQHGTQMHATSNYRRVVEIVQAGVIGSVRRVHVWQGGGLGWRNGVTRGVRVKEGTPPAHVNYDLWLGPAPERPFHVSHFHFNWRYWWDFGGGQLADFWCHYADLPFWALGLTHPVTVEAFGEKGHDGDTGCPNFMRVEYEYPARGDQPPVHLTWYHGGWKPEGAEVYEKNSAVLFEGEDGRLLADYGTHKLFMEADQSARPVEQSIPESIGHHEEWLEAIRTGGETTCPFEYGGMLTESAHLGNVSYRLGGKKLEWDAENLRAVNCPEADQFIRREYREGWTL